MLRPIFWPQELICGQNLAKIANFTFFIGSRVVWSSYLPILMKNNKKVKNTKRKIDFSRFLKFREKISTSFDTRAYEKWQYYFQAKSLTKHVSLSSLYY